MNKSVHDSETKAKGQQVITACAFIHHKFDGIDKVFLAKRASTKKFLPGVFELPGGHIDFGEEMIDGLKREIKEEFEMDLEVGDPFFVFTYTNDVKQSHSIEVVYFAHFTNDISEIVIHPDDHSEYRWLEGREIASILDDKKGASDPEIQAIYRGFALLAGCELDY